MEIYLNPKISKTFIKSKNGEYEHKRNWNVFLIFGLFHGNYSNEGCTKVGDSDCGNACTGTPACDGRRCGNVDNMCYCHCGSYTCKPTELGYTWNKGIKLANGS